MISTSIGTNESSFPFYLVSLETDGGGDHKPRHIRNQLALFGLFLLGNMDKLNVARVCPGVYFLNISNRAMDFLNIGLSGLTLKSNVQVGDEFLIGEVIGKVSSMKLVRKYVQDYDTDLPFTVFILEHCLGRNVDVDARTSMDEPDFINEDGGNEE